jgi:hypothetical protein
VSGAYNRNGITGTEKDGKFTFTYYEPGVTGEGVFEMAPDGQSFSGKWLPAGGRRGRTGPAGGCRTPSTLHNRGHRGRYRTSRSRRCTGTATFRRGCRRTSPKVTPTRTGIGLYEWVKLWEVTEAKLAEFKALDLNGDGLLTAEDYLRAQKAAATIPPSPGGQPVIAPPPGARPVWGQPPGSGTPLPPSYGKSYAEQKLVPDPKR